MLTYLIYKYAFNKLQDKMLAGLFVFIGGLATVLDIYFLSLIYDCIF